MSDDPLSEPTRLVVGHVRGVHGLHGLVRVEILTDRPEDRFAVGRVLHREGSPAPLTITSAAPVDDGPGWRLGFREIVDRTAADRLRGAYLETAVDRADLAEGEAFWHEVVGARVLGSDGRELGRVAEVYRAGEAEVYVVRGGPAGEFDLPAVRTVITSFDPRGAGIAVDEAALDLSGAPIDARPARERKPRRWSRHGKGGASTPPTPDGATDPEGPEAAGS
ncbi:MAG TPA: ribosome maturation factor RimM [Candidatus Limnocylindrales bacterium]